MRPAFAQKQAVRLSRTPTARPDFNVDVVDLGILSPHLPRRGPATRPARHFSFVRIFPPAAISRIVGRTRFDPGSGDDCHLVREILSDPSLECCAAQLDLHSCWNAGLARWHRRSSPLRGPGARRPARTADREVETAPPEAGKAPGAPRRAGLFCQYRAIGGNTAARRHCAAVMS